ncbi:MAG: TlpA family protein disulfide reductase [Polyangiaceae bacterium]|nr:TlpA family protein disulfide reductase [Polyangiaceae bacterium]
MQMLASRPAGLRRTTPVLIACAALGLAACSDSGGGGEIKARSDVVPGSARNDASAVKQPGSTATSSAPEKPRKLCSRGLSKPGAKPGSVKMTSVQATDESALGDSLELGGGKWTWINVWAGWCEPCLEEIPLLKQWETKLKDKLRVEFVSVDDDARLAVRFLNSQPKGGVRRSHHIEDVDARTKWFETMGATTSTLPLQILVDPDGVVQCVANGSVRASDLPEIEALVAK